MLNHDEAGRIAALERYAILDTAQDPAYDNFTRLAAEICGTPVSLVSLIDSTRQWFKSSTGRADVSETPREYAFCSHAIESDELFEIEDATSDPRFVDNPLVRGDPNIRFYAGVPLVGEDGFAIGTLCTFDMRPRVLTQDQRAQLRRLATSLMRLVESRRDVPERSLEQQAVFNAAYQFAADPIAVLRVARDRGDSTIAFVNRAFADLFGYDPAALIGGNLRMLEGDKTEELKMARLRAAGVALEFGHETTYLYASTGAPRYVELRERVVDSAHRILSVRDLTRMQETQEILSDTNQRLQSLLANNSDAMLAIDVRGSCIEANPATATTFGFERRQLLGSGYLEVAPDGIFPSKERFAKALFAGRTLEFEATLRHANGTPIDVEVKAVPMILRGVTEAAFLVFRDVTRAKRLARVVAEQNRRTRSLYLISAADQTSGEQQIDAALKLVVDLMDMDYAYVGRVSGDSITIENASGLGANNVGDVVPLSRTLVAQTLAHGDVVAIEDIDPIVKGLEDIPEFPGYHAYISSPLVIGGATYGAIGFSSKRRMSFKDHDRDFIRLVAALVASAIERQIQQKRLDDLAFYDALTGLPNRLRLMQELEAAIARSQRHGGSFALHFIDLDGFKSVNDRGGHAVGDEVLVEVARRMSTIHRPYDVPARLGGDEFVVLQPEADLRADVQTLAQRIVDVLSEPYLTSAGEMIVGASVGVAFFPADASDAAMLLRRADKALYFAKANGKKRVEFFTESLLGQ